MNLLKNQLDATFEITESKIWHDSFKKLLYEECHAFEKQYSIANYIVNKTIENIKKGVKQFTLDYQNQNKVIDKITITIQNSFNGELCKGAICSFDDETNTVGIVLTIDFREIKNYTENEIKNAIFSVVAHELMHNHIYIKEYEKYNNIKLASPNYYSIINLMHDKSLTNDEYYFVYSLYAYSFQETQAIISQAWPALKTILDCTKTKKETINDLKTWIADIEPYRTFSNMALISQKILNKESIKYKICGFVRKNNLLEPSQVENIAKGMLKCAKKSLQKVINNCYYYACKYDYIK